MGSSVLKSARGSLDYVETFNPRGPLLVRYRDGITISKRAALFRIIERARARVSGSKEFCDLVCENVAIIPFGNKLKNKTLAERTRVIRRQLERDNRISGGGGVALSQFRIAPSEI